MPTKDYRLIQELGLTEKPSIRQFCSKGTQAVNNVMGQRGESPSEVHHSALYPRAYILTIKGSSVEYIEMRQAYFLLAYRQ